MHSLRSLVLVPAILVAGACSKGDDRTASSSPLDRDLTLSAQLQGGGAQPGVELAASGACAVQPAAKAPTATQRAQALSLEQKAGEAEFVGNIAAARDLHRQAARLDATSEAIAYRLARADEASGDSASAVAGYCRYLSLAPSAANARDVRARLSALLTRGGATQVARASSPTVTRSAMVAAAPLHRSAGRRLSASSSVAAAPSVTTTAAAPSAEPEVVAGPNESANVSSSSGEVVASAPQAETQAPAPSEPAPQVRRPADHTARDAAIGAAAGAAIGAMTSRSVRGAVLGGVAGGVLGAVVSRAGSGFRTPGFSH